MKKQFTQGQWKVENSEHIGAINVSFGDFLGGIECWYHHGHTKTKEESIANAKLISAAPEMFEMLEKILNIEDHAFTLKGFDVKRLKSEILETLNKATK